MSRSKNLIVILVFSLCFVVQAFAANSFVVSRIKVQGLQRVSEGTFFSYLPIKEGDTINGADSGKIIEALYKTGFFTDIQMYRKGNELVFVVSERAVIGSLHVSGNKAIQTKQLLSALKEANISEGQVFDHSVLVGLRQALLQQYYNLGYYNVRVDTDISKQQPGRVAINIKIHEGPIAKIKQIKIIGNFKYSDATLLKNFSLTTPTLWSWITKSDQYSKQKLEADIEGLKSYYMDRGYLEMKVDSTQVSITPDKSQVFIIIHINEGPQFKVSGVSLSGNLLGKDAALKKLITIKPGDVFSRQRVIDLDTTITRFYGDMGYAFTQVEPVPKINDKNNSVFIVFNVNPNRKVYVRRINFVGNTRTADYVLRREMRQMEGGLYSLSKIEESKRRLMNLGYLDDVSPKLKNISSTSNQVDVDYNVKEKSSAMASFQVGYSDAEGFLYGAGVNESNFLGTGKGVGIQFNNSSLVKNYSLSYFDPYFTVNNVSLNINVYAQNMTPGSEDLSSYSTDVLGSSVSFGYPISDYSSLSFGGGVEQTNLITSATNSPQNAIDFVRDHGHIFNETNLTAGWDYSSLDRALFPTKGIATSLGAKLTLPLGGMRYYKINYDFIGYLPIFWHLIMDSHFFAGYGGGYSFMAHMPFFKNFFAGGIGSVRGYEANSMGPRDSYGDPMGGNLSVNGSLGLILPNPLTDNVRTTLFFDAGNVYRTYKDPTDNNPFYDKLNKGVRFSTGVQVEWRTPIAPITFSLGWPINKQRGDDTTVFQFSLSTSF